MISLAGKSLTARSEDLRIGGDVRAWEELVSERERAGTSIDEHIEWLMNSGFSRAMIAELLCVNVSDVQRWRSTEVGTVEEEQQVREIMAFCDLLRFRFGVDDPAAWFEVRLNPGCAIQGMEVFGTGHADLMLEFAGGWKSADEVLDAFDPGWRDAPPSMWEVAVGDDGFQYIRMKGQQ